MKKIQIKQGIVDLKNSDAVIAADLFAEGVVDNDYFTDAGVVAQGVKVKTAADKLKGALDAPKSATKSSTIASKRADLEKEVFILTNLEENVVNAANVSDDVKIDMVKSANREVVVHPVRQKYNFTAKAGSNNGEVDFTAETKDAVAHLYTWTQDLENFTNKADPLCSAGAKKTAKGLPLEIELAFFHKAIFARKEMDWEGPIYLTLHKK